MEHALKLAGRYDEATFLERKNRFTLLLQLRGRPITAYLANTGRLEEHLVPGSILFVAPSPTSSTRHRYRVISSLYRGTFVLLDTKKSSRIVCELLVRNALIESKDITDIEHEPYISGKRLDILVKRKEKPPLIIEVKHCTLCHRGIALFPDAPSRRATQQIELLQRLASSGYDACILILIPMGDGRFFLPNLHTDAVFTRALLAAKEVDVRAIGVALTDPVTVNLGSYHELTLSYNVVYENLGGSGSYLLVLENGENREIEVGKLGRVLFEKGYYVYVGSGMNGVDKRIARHYRKKKSYHWHIDYITPSHMRILRSYTIRSAKKVEENIAARLEKICHRSIEGFGSSDSNMMSHLFFFPSIPHQKREFLDLVLDFMTFHAP